ncbi:Arm DNA-binding domain-containing protein [Laribacter hongkongensis]|uniref:Arm DNA-binding domain-containing protein n=1 Tax=Laribacter hongkongensis TaxID=168471 RepID=UPI004032CD37
MIFVDTMPDQSGCTWYQFQQNPCATGLAADFRPRFHHGIGNPNLDRSMLTDTKLRNLKPQEKMYKVANRDGLYVAVTPAGGISFRCNYLLNGRQETITFGRYGLGGITLAEARERLGKAKKMIAAGKSPAKEKARDKARVKGAETFGAWAEKWLHALAAPPLDHRNVGPSLSRPAI